MHTNIKNLLEASGVDFGTDVSMRDHTTFRIGGPADYFITPKTAEELSSVIGILKNEGCPITVIGNGSNLLVRDGGIRGAVVRISSALSKAEVNGESIFAEAGILLSLLSSLSFSHDLAGMEFASGIPGSLGGAIYMNAGAYGGEMSQILKSVTFLNEKLETVTLPVSELNLGYRHSMFMASDCVILRAELALKKGDGAASRELANDFNARRRDKQPLEFPSAGSVFKRPEGYFAGALIEGAGLKGCAIGGACVSEKHAGFIVNKGGATANDVLALCEHIIETVRKKYGVTLERELKVIGEDE